MATTTPPLEETVPTRPRLRALPGRHTLRRAAWLVLDVGATAAFLVHALS